MKFIYPAIVHNDPDGMWAEFPDLTGCYTQGDTEDEILSGAAEAMEGWIIVTLEHGGKLPTPTVPNKIRLEDDHSYTILVRSDVDLAKNTKSVKKTLTIPGWLNEEALKKNLNFSAILQAGLVNALQKE